MPTTSKKQQRSPSSERAKLVFSLLMMFCLGVLLVVLANTMRTSTTPSEFHVDTKTNIATISIRPLTSSPVPSLLSAAGGVLLGVALSTLIGAIFVPSYADGIAKMLSDLHAFPLKSNDEELKQFRKRFHGYLFSQNPDKSWAWRYRIFDFEQDRSNGYLHAIVKYPADNGEERQYRYLGLVFHQSLFLIGFNELIPNERPIVHLFPTWGWSHIHAGYAFLETLAGASVVTRTILSTEELAKGLVPGSTKDATICKALHRDWRATFTNMHVDKDLGVDTPEVVEAAQ